MKIQSSLLSFLLLSTLAQGPNLAQGFISANSISIPSTSTQYYASLAETVSKPTTVSGDALKQTNQDTSIKNRLIKVGAIVVFTLLGVFMIKQKVNDQLLEIGVADQTTLDTSKKAKDFGKQTDAKAFSDKLSESKSPERLFISKVKELKNIAQRLIDNSQKSEWFDGELDIRLFRHKLLDLGDTATRFSKGLPKILANAANFFVKIKALDAKAFGDKLLDLGDTATRFSRLDTRELLTNAQEFDGHLVELGSLSKRAYAQSEIPMWIRNLFIKDNVEKLDAQLVELGGICQIAAVQLIKPKILPKLIKNAEGIDNQVLQVDKLAIPKMGNIIKSTFIRFADKMLELGYVYYYMHDDYDMNHDQYYISSIYKNTEY